VLYLFFGDLNILFFKKLLDLTGWVF